MSEYGGWLRRPRKLNPILSVGKAKKQQPVSTADTLKAQGLAALPDGAKTGKLASSLRYWPPVLFHNPRWWLQVYFPEKVKDGFWIWGCQVQLRAGVFPNKNRGISTSLHIECWNFHPISYFTAVRMLIARVIPTRQEWATLLSGESTQPKKDLTNGSCGNHLTAKFIDHMPLPSTKSFWSVFGTLLFSMIRQPKLLNLNLI